MTEQCTKRAVDFYASFVDTVVPAKGTREAEMAKLLENTYRHINIALVNEMARFSHELGIHLWNVIECAKTKPFSFQAFYPGPGVGGHCIPIDPNYLSHTVQARLHYPFRFVELAQEVNAGMPKLRRPPHPGPAQRRRQGRAGIHRAAARRHLQGRHRRRARVTGRTPCGEVARAGGGPAVSRPLRHRLERRRTRPPQRQLKGESDLGRALQEADVVVLLQAHREYLDGVLDGVRVFDTRGVLVGEGVERL